MTERSPGAAHMRQLMETVSTQPSLEEAKPFGLMQQLKLAARGLVNPAATQQLQLNQYANTLYTEWKKQAEYLKKTRAGTAGEPTARDFLSWYGSHSASKGRMDPATVSAVQVAMRQLRIDLDSALSDDQLEQLCKQIAALVLAKHVKVSTGLLRTATPDEENQIFELFGRIDDLILKNKARLSLKKLADIITSQIGTEGIDPAVIPTAVRRGFAQAAKELRARGHVLPTAATDFKSANTASLNTVQTTQLLQVLPTLLLMILRNLSAARTTDPEKPAAPPAPLSPADYATAYAQWQAALNPLGFGPDEIRNLVNRQLGIA